MIASFRWSNIIINVNYHAVGLFQLTFINKCISFRKLGYCFWNFVYSLFDTLFLHSSKSLSLNTATFSLSLLSKIETSCKLCCTWLSSLSSNNSTWLFRRCWTLSEILNFIQLSCNNDHKTRLDLAPHSQKSKTSFPKPFT